MKYGLLKDGDNQYIVKTQHDGSLRKIGMGFGEDDLRVLVVDANGSEPLVGIVDDATLTIIKSAVESALAGYSVRSDRGNYVDTDQLAEEIYRRLV